MDLKKNYVTSYQDFRGVDYSASPAVISEVHAQDMLNMYIGSDGVMQKRPGWHILRTFENISEFNETTAYVPGDYVVHENVKHRCIANHTGEWNADHFSKDFSTSTSYSVGDYVRRSKNIYRCIVSHQGTWVNSHFTLANPARLMIHGIHYVQYEPGMGMMFIHAGNRLFGTMFVRQDVGDVNGDGQITAADASLIYSIVSGKITPTDEELARADVNGDGQVTNADAVAILRMVVGKAPYPNQADGVLENKYFVVTREGGTPLELAQQRSISFEHESNLYILDGVRYVRLVSTWDSDEVSVGGDTIVVPYIDSVYAEDVAGYIPTTGVNGHYEYLEPQTETRTGDTIVENQTVTAKVADNKAKATFPALAPFLNKIKVSMQVNDQVLCTNAVVKTKNQAATVSGITLRNSSGSVFAEGLTLNDSIKLKILQGDDEDPITVVAEATKTATAVSNAADATFAAKKGFASVMEITLVVNQTTVCDGESFESSDNTVPVGIYNLTASGGSVTVDNLYVGDRVTLFIKEPDEDVDLIGEPGSATNSGEWKKPEADEDRNLLQTKQINTFTTDGFHQTYYLTENNCDVDKVELYVKTRCKSVNGVDTPTQENIDHIDAGTYNGVYYYYTSLWTEVPRANYSVIQASSETTATNKISYTTRVIFKAEHKPDASPDGEVNLRVTFAPRSHSSAQAIAKDRGYIEKCTLFTKFGYFNDNRFFIAGNPEHRNMDFMSAIDDPTYFPNTGWTKIGSELTAIQGYLHYGSELAILKEDNEQDATIYMRSAILTEDNNILFPVQQGAEGAGAISQYANCTLRDVPLYLAKEGVYAIQGTDASQERNIPNKSFFVDPVLRKEISKSCHAVAWGDYFVLCNPAKGRCYVADARYQALPPGTNDRSHVYEWYVWNNIPALCFEVVGDRLFFGTADGRLCVFNTDWDHPKRWTDGGEFIEGQDVTKIYKWNAYDGGFPIHAYYVTKRDHLAAIDFKKTMLNDGGVITLEPHDRSSAAITVRTDKGEWFVNQEHTDSDEPSMVIPIRHRFKNFDSIETRIENNEIREGLSILGLQYRYCITTNRR